MKALLSSLSIAALLTAAPLKAEPLAEHTVLIVWAAENCEGFTYSEDLLRHARIEVISAGKDAAQAIAKEVLGGLEAIFGDDQAEICETVNFLIENPEEES